MAFPELMLEHRDFSVLLMITGSALITIGTGKLEMLGSPTTPLLPFSPQF